MEPPRVDGVPVMPRDVLTSDDWRARNRWLREHGCDPAKWPEVRAILLASEAAHGIESSQRRLTVAGALERARQAHEGDQDVYPA